MRLSWAILSVLTSVLLLGAGAANAATLEVEVEAPSWTKSDVFVAASVAQNGRGAWSADAVRLSRNGSRWTGSIVGVPDGATVEWKLTGGSWATVEKGPRNDELANRKTVVRGTTRAFAHVFHWGDDTIFSPKGQLMDAGVFAPRTLRPRSVAVYLPPGYDDPKNANVRYPVLYVLDGQNLFDPYRSATGVTWRLGEALDDHFWSGKTATIAVAIDNTQDRMDEYTPSRDKSYGGGRLEEFASFLLDELKPSMDHLLRTRSSADDTGIMGSSLGGLAAIHIGWKHSDKVRRIGALSPSLWWNNQDTLAMIKNSMSKPPLKVWLSIGDKESSSAVPQTRAVAQALETRGFRHFQDLALHEVKGAGHNEGAWAYVTPNTLSFLYP